MADDLADREGRELPVAKRSRNDDGGDESRTLSIWDVPEQFLVYMGKKSTTDEVHLRNLTPKRSRRSSPSLEDRTRRSGKGSFGVERRE